MKDDIVCPRCKSTKYRNPHLRLLVNACGHYLCEGCIDVLFVKPVVVCGLCGMVLNRDNFRARLFDNVLVNKEVEMRTTLLGDFCKEEQDFASLDEYNAYLEMLETVVYNLVNGIDVANTKIRIEEFRRQNEEWIAKNRGKKPAFLTKLEAILDEEKRKTEMRRCQDKIEKERRARLAEMNMEALIRELESGSSGDRKDDIANGDQGPGRMIEDSMDLAGHSESSPFTTGASTSCVSPPLRTARHRTVSHAKYGRHGDLCGPPPPEDVEMSGHIKNVRSVRPIHRTGGFQDSLACKRALQDAFNGLFFDFEESSDFGNI